MKPAVPAAPHSLDASTLLTSTRILLFALSAGVLVASLYYVQPLTSMLAASFGVSVPQAGYLVTATQIGYVLGIVFLVPLSDVLNRRQLLTWMLVAKMGALLLAATSQNIIVFAIASVLMGITASALMVVTAMVASYAPDHSRGRMVGTVMTGLLLGILLARTVSGTVAQISGGWRTVYVLAAIVVAALLVMLRRILPADRGYARQATWLLAVASIAGWALIGFGAHSLVLLLIGIVLLDMGVMGLQVTHQSIIYKLAPHARARVTTVFIAGGFIGASAGSALASASFAAGGWPALCMVGGAMPLLMLLVWSKYRHAQRRLERAP